MESQKIQPVHDLFIPEIIVAHRPRRLEAEGQAGVIIEESRTENHMSN